MTQTDDEPLYVENCKHSGPDALIVQRNQGIRWVTCTDCGADFVRKEFYDDLLARVAKLETGIGSIASSTYPGYVDEFARSLLPEEADDGR